MSFRGAVCVFVWLLAIALAAGPVLAQVNAVDLTGQIYDPQGLAVTNAKVTVRNLATGAERSTTSDSDGRYQIVGLPPGRYELSVEAKGFAKLVNPEIVLTLGMAAQFDAHMSLAGGQQVVTVTGEPELIETRRTSVSQTITPLQIDNLPINGRNYINFTLLNSQSQRDSAPSIGAAPTSGLNFGGQRARSNEVSVDGADAVDNSVNGIRTTVSQEAVQEFQLIISNYMPEFGRATGGVVNIVTKSGSNEVHGNVFGYLRHKSIQARNPFSVNVDPATGAVTAVKQPFTRVQAGATLGGPIKKDKSFYFFSYETTRRQETGFTDIGSSSACGLPVPCRFGIDPTTGLTPEQENFLANPPPGLIPLQLAFYQGLAASGSSVALSGIDPGLIAFGFGAIPAPTPGARFPVPVDCKPIFLGGPPCSASNVVPLPGSFVPLTALIGNYPIKEATSLWSARLDHIWNTRNSSFVRVSVSPSLVTGIQVNAQNQNFGENAGSRTSLQQARDLAIVGQHVTTIGDSLFNEARYQFSRRGLHYGFSQLPGGSNVAVNITGFAFFGREPFSTVDRIERRNQWTDNLTWTHGRHTFKFGADANLIQIRSAKSEIFELNFGGIFDFGGLAASTASGGLIPDCVGPSAATDALCNLSGDTRVPAFNAVQTYGLGDAQVFIQGIGNSDRPFDNPTLGAFIQDSWKVNNRLTLNYGVRYDIEWTPTFKPGTPLNAAAEPAMKVIEGIPRDSNNVAPRFGFAWDPAGDGKTVIRGGYGIFYDHPLLAVAFDSTTAEGALSSQLIAAGGTPTGASPLTNPAALNAATLFQGILGGVPSGGNCGPGVLPSFGYVCSQQRFNPLLPNSFFTNQNFIQAGLPIGILPFTLPVARNFVYGYAQQANLTVERELTKDFKISVAYSYTRGLHLNRPRNINAPLPGLEDINENNAIRLGLAAAGSDPRTLTLPSGAGPCIAEPGGSFLVIAPSVLGVGFTDGSCGAGGGSRIGFIGFPAAFNFFRPSGPNPSFATTTGVGVDPAKFAGLVGLATLAGFPTGFGVPVPWSDVLQQESSGNSVYHGMTVTVSKRFSHHTQLYSSYTWSHAIDDSTDLQTLLAPQDNRFPNRERSNSSFDQRHRWVTSAVFESPYKNSDEGFRRKFLADFTIAPVAEVSSGRPFTILTGSDVNLDFGATTDRPSVVRLAKGAPPPAGAVVDPFIHGFAFLPANVCDTGSLPLLPTPPVGCVGNLGRNAFTRPGFFTMDLRVSRKFWIGEKLNLEVIADGFNLLNRFNVGDVNPLCDPSSGSCSAGQPTAALDPRQFQFALKLNW
jgi:carboxypeptidase family protein/TonB-dependent receptor-like protein